MMQQYVPRQFSILNHTLEYIDIDSKWIQQV